MNCYQILEVNRNASCREIKKSYYKLAKKFHPDKNGNEIKFKEINNAYVILIDEEKRKMYDKYISSNNKDVLNENPYDVINEILNKYNLSFFKNVFSKIYEGEEDIKNDINNLDFKSIYEKFKNYYKLDIEKEIYCNIEDILLKNNVSINFERKVKDKIHYNNLIIENFDIYDSELVYENLGNEVGNFKGNLLIKIIINESKIYEIGDNYDLIAKLSNLDMASNLNINIDLNKKRFLFENDKSIIYEINGYGFYDYENKKYGNLYLKINK